MNKQASNMFDTIIAGGGAAGMIAAITLKSKHPKLNIAIFEKLPRVGKKISVTGNGRCNITNLSINKHNYYSDDLDKALDIINRFDYSKTKAFFSDLGVEFISEENKTFPRSFQASSVVDALRFKLEVIGVKLFTEAKITSAKKRGDKFSVLTEGDEFLCKSLLITTGGMAGGKGLGSEGDGYGIFKSFGHKIIEQNPVICQLKTENEITKVLKGIKVNAAVRVTEGGKAVAKDFGEVLFCDYGLSGPPILQLSRHCKKGTTLHLDLLPELTEDELFSLITKRKNILSAQPLTEFFAGLLHKKLGSTLIKAAGIPLSCTASYLTQRDIKNITKIVKDFSFKVIGHNGFINAQATSGGAAFNEFDGNLMSLKCSGLFGAGEVLNVDGDCGGYNLQWAWSSGAAAALGIARFLKV